MDDVYRAIDSVFRLLTAISAEEVEPVELMKTEILGVKFDEQLRSQKRRENRASPSRASQRPGLRP